MTSNAALRDAWGTWIDQQGPWHVFGALTYDPARRARPGDDRPVPADVAKAHVRRWLRDTDKALNKRLEAAVVALEYQKNGWPHFHPLLRLAGGLQGREFTEAGQAWYRPHGYARLEEPRTQLEVAAYASKYLVKDLQRGDVLFWPLRGPWTPHQAELSDLVAIGAAGT